MTAIDHDAVLNRWLRGEGDKQIATALGLKGSHTVRTIVQRARKQNDPRAVRGGNRFSRLQMIMPNAGAPLRSLKSEAARRSMDPAELAREIVEIVCAENLFSAVLGEDHA